MNSNNFKFKTKGVCSPEITFSIEDGKLRNVKFSAGCNGNSSGIGALVEGMNVDDVISKLSGIRCDRKSTSCPDQLAKALISAKVN
ncbi:MAG: TIGR03905 family TSCPD domain-containing protein [Clostridiales bacterium]|jgi:uncharacterized protein (TIGR03905 family)|nr:TIGR03905 family TSCPD domain-containing protein [Clostridiales bacterium]